MINKSLFVKIALMLASTSAYSQTIGFDLVSYHADNNRDGYQLNNVNPGVYVSYNNFTLGLAKNSWRKAAPYLLYSPHPNISVGISQYTAFQYEYRKVCDYPKPTCHLDYYEWDHHKRIIPLYFLTEKFGNFRVSINHEFVHLSYEF